MMNAAGGLHMYASGLSRLFMTSTLLIAGFATYQRLNLPVFTRPDVIEESYDQSESTWCVLRVSFNWHQQGCTDTDSDCTVFHLEDGVHSQGCADTDSWLHWFPTQAWRLQP